MATKQEFTSEQLLDTLKRARSKIVRSGTWTRHAWVRRLTKDEMAEYGDNQLYAYCATGAVGSAVKELGEGRALRTAAVSELGSALPDSYGFGVEGYNDAHTHKDVIKLFDKSIKKLEGQVSG